MPSGTPSPPDSTDTLRKLPSVHHLVELWGHRNPDSTPPRPLVVEGARAALQQVRVHLTNGAHSPLLNDPTDHLLSAVSAFLHEIHRPVLAPVINATGIIIHTGLGRSPLAESAVTALTEIAGRYTPVELDLESGERGHRTHLVRDLLCTLTGAESATVVNNNAAALILSLAALARDREVIVSRGELIEIGGSFRLPDIMHTSGAIMREVGTTNRTRIADFRSSINDSTVALMKVHPSNYRVEGFTAEVTIEELAALGHKHNLPVIHDIGSGALQPTRCWGWDSDEPNAHDSLAAGADLVLFSGDKLLGGPQAGIIVGKKTLIDRLEKHPLMRAFRMDKILLAALAATLQLHRDPESAARTIPIHRLLTSPLETISRRCHDLADQLQQASQDLTVNIRKSDAYLGGGTVPTHAIPSHAVVLHHPSFSAHELAARLRTGDPGVIARVKDGALWLDLRTVFPDEDPLLLHAIVSALPAP